MKKISLIAAFVLLISIFTAIPVNAISFTPNESVYSEAVLLKNLDTGTTIYEKNADQKVYPASLTKIMTAILVLENIPDLDNTMITAEPSLFDELYLIGASTADFRPYETASAKDLMYGMMLQSACEAASILGYYVGGDSIENFIIMMNNKAKEIGCTDTHFTNAHGLFSENQYTTAKDMAIITEYAMKLPQFMEISCTNKYEIPPSNKHTESRIVAHTNLMMDKARGGEKYYYENIKGIKTGTLDEAGRCLVSTASKNGYNYMLITFNAPMKDDEGNNVYYNFLDAKSLYEWAFKYFSYTDLIGSEEEIAEVKVRFSNDNDFVLVRPDGEYSTLWPSTIDTSSIQRIVNIEKDEIDAPVAKGTKLGTVDLMLSGVKITSLDLIAANDVERSELKYNLFKAKEFFTSTWFKIGVGVAIGLIVIYIIMFLIYSRKKKIRRKKVNRKRQF